MVLNILVLDGGVSFVCEKDDQGRSVKLRR